MLPTPTPRSRARRAPVAGPRGSQPRDDTPAPAPDPAAGAALEREIRARALEDLARWQPVVTTRDKARCQVLDVFSGCGGMSLGFAAVSRSTGAYRLLGGIDVDARSAASYRANFGVGGHVLDIRDLHDDPSALSGFLEAVGYDPNLPLVMIGCAPCQGFTAHRKRHWGRDDERNSLVTVLARIARTVQPDFVVMENVPELLSHRYWDHYRSFCEILESYEIKTSIHNTAAFGTPQERFRALVVAGRGDRFGLPSPWLEPPRFRTVRDAIGSLPPVEPGTACATDPMHRCARHRPSTLDVLRQVRPDGGSRPRGVGPRCLDKTKGFSDVYGRLYWDRPSVTITHYARNPASGRFVHPEQLRGLTMREAARLQGFPDGFVFEGAYDDVYRQIGEAVPPPFSTAVASSLLVALDGLHGGAVSEPLVTSPVNDSYAGVIAGMKMKRR